MRLSLCLTSLLGFLLLWQVGLVRLLPRQAFLLMQELTVGALMFPSLRLCRKIPGGKVTLFLMAELNRRIQIQRKTLGQTQLLLGRTVSSHQHRMRVNGRAALTGSLLQKGR